MMRTLLLLLLLPSLAFAQAAGSDRPVTQATAPVSPKAPITIEASGSLVWKQADKTYHALGDAVATRGAMTVHADELTAHYTENNGQNEIQALEAMGHVTILNNGSTASGPYARYDMTTGDMKLTGTDLKLSNAKNETLTAQQEISFNDKTGQSYAIGQPLLARPDRTLAAVRLDGQFVKDAQNAWTLQTATATDNVVIRTGLLGANPSVSTSDHGFYDAQKDTALLSGHVKLSRGQNQMNGDRAEIDMKTGLSRLLPSAEATSPDHRVRAILYQNK